MDGHQKTLCIVIASVCFAIAAFNIGCVAYCGVQP